MTGHELKAEMKKAAKTCGIDLSEFRGDWVVTYNPPVGSTYGDFILIPSEGYDYEDMMYFEGQVNLTDVAGWDIQGGPGAALARKIDPSLPAWLFYSYRPENTLYVYRF